MLDQIVEKKTNKQSISKEKKYFYFLNLEKIKIKK
jgi:hypothetical protein